MPRNKLILHEPPPVILGSQREHENNVQRDLAGQVVTDVTGAPKYLEERERGGCFLLLVLNRTKKLHAHEEKKLRWAIKTAHDVIADHAGSGTPRPFTKDQALALFDRLHEAEPNLVSGQTEAWCQAEEYLNAYLGGDEVAAQLRSIYVEAKPEDPKTKERAKAVAIVAATIDAAWAEDEQSTEPTSVEPPVELAASA